MWKKSDWKLFWIFLIVAAWIITLNGILTEVNLGDESHHYRFAQNIYSAGKRVAFDPLYESGYPPGFFYNDPPFWHLLLAFIWKISGGTSQAVAQIYHILFFIILLWSTSALAKEIIGEEKKWLSAFIIATVPMVVSFSTLFYMDIPMTALITLSFYLIWKRRYIEAGVASALAYFIKLNAGFLFPGFVFMIAWNEKDKVWNLLKNLVFFVLPILIIYFPDIYWRKKNINPKLDPTNISSTADRISNILSGARTKEYLNSYTTNPEDLVRYFGLAFLFILVLYFFRFKQWRRKDAVLWVPVISYLAIFVIFFGFETDIRYLMPILPFLIVLSTTVNLSLGRWWQFAIISICLLQFISTTYYVHQRRQISPEVKDVFEYIKINVPQNALILYPEVNLLIYGQRRMVWSAMEGVNREGLSSLFWGSDYQMINDHLKAAQIDHILVKKSRIYDDQQEQHLGGYPKSFVERLPDLKGWGKIFENPGVVLFEKVRR